MFQRARIMRFSTLLVVIWACCCGLLYWATREDPGVSPDSVTYILAANNLLAGKGLVVNDVPLTHFPPLYPALLALVGWLSRGDIISGARFLCAMLYGLNVILVGIMVYLNANSNALAAFCAMILVVSSKYIFRVHTWIWSEPTFFALVDFGLIALFYYYRKHSTSSLVIASILLGLSALTRYVGIALLPAFLIIVMLLEKSLSVRIQRALLVGTIPCTLIGSWIMRNLITANNATNRSIAVHPVSYADLRRMVWTFNDYFLPWRIPGAIFLSILIFGASLYCMGILFLWKKGSKDWLSERLFLPIVSALYAASYCGFLLLSKSFFDAATHFDYRILSPVYIWMVMGLVSLLASTAGLAGRRKWQWIPIVIVLILAIANGSVTLSFANSLRHEGQGYTSRQWDISPTLEALSTIPNNVLLWSNGADVLAFRTSNNAIRRLPAHTNSLSLETNVHFPSEMAEMCETIKQGNAIIVYFHVIHRWYLPTTQEITMYCTGLTAREFPDGMILFAEKMMTSFDPNP